MSHKVAHNALWNVGGQVVSLGVGLVALPILLHALGAARLGVFTLALGLIGFSGLFVLGLGRALRWNAHVIVCLIGLTSERITNLTYTTNRGRDR